MSSTAEGKADELSGWLLTVIWEGSSAHLSLLGGCYLEMCFILTMQLIIEDVDNYRQNFEEIKLFCAASVAKKELLI